VRPVRLLVLLFLCLGIAGAAWAQAAAAVADRPKIGLVLSGGGARGGAHIGVLKVLEELQVPIDIIVGTSAGSIVGAAYASGMPLEDIEAVMGTISTVTLFHDIDRASQPLRRKADDALNFIGPEVGFGPQGISLPKGAIAGVSLEAVLRRLTIRQRHADFDRLPIRFRAIATDVASGEMVVLGGGSLTDAIRASMAIPAAVTPVEIDGRLLVDGGIARNLPVDVARQLGAQVVIAVNIGTPLLGRDDITSLLSVSDQMIRILTARNVAQSISELGPDDLLITPDLGTIATADFDRLREAAEAGAVATRAMSASLDRYRVAAAAYARTATERTMDTDTGPPHIDEVRVEGIKRVNEEVVRAAMDTQPGTIFDEAVADADLKRIYARGDFERVSYYLTMDPDGRQILVTDIAEKSWGPHYLRFGLALSTDFAGSSYFNALASHRWTWMNRLGAEWRNDLQIGHTEVLRTEWYQPLSPAQRWFVSAHAGIETTPFDVYLDGQNIARFARKTSGVGLDIGVPFGTAGELRFGTLRGRVKFDDEIGLVPAGALSEEELGALLLQVRVDKLDSLRFPRFGYAGALRLVRSSTDLGATSDYAKASLLASGAYSIGPHTLRLALNYASPLGDADLPVHELSTLGGFLRLSGYRNDEFLGTGVRFGRLVYNYRLSGPGFLEGLFVGVSAEAGRIGRTLAGEPADVRHGNSIFLAVDTPIGPLYLAYGRATSANQAVYLFLGQP
jgi:NTE family protein